MRMEMKYRLRRVIAAIILVSIFAIFTSIVIQKGSDALIEQDRIMWERHKETWGMEL